jgi:TPR repeat protein
MIPTWISIALDFAVAALLAAAIVYAIRLNRTLEKLREGKAELGTLIGRFDEAAAHAERSVARFGQSTAEQGKLLNSAIAEAQALRDELAFMLERGDNVADRIANLTPSKPARKPAPIGIEPDSEMERDLKRALKLARKAG